MLDLEQLRARSIGRRHRCAGALACAAGLVLAPAAWSHTAEPAEATPSPSARGHGSVWIELQDTFVNGRLNDRGPKAEIGTVRIQSLNLGLEYYMAERWSVLASLPFIRSRYQGPRPHCPTAAPAACRNIPALVPPHPESRFLDDGAFHASWQDWTLGVAWHPDAGNYLITPSITAFIPSHDYPFFAQAAVGQRLKKLAFGIDLAHQLEFSNLYYRVGYARVIAEKTLGYSIDHNRYDAELGYFVNPRLAIRGFGHTKLGGGLQDSQLRPLIAGGTNEVFYHHDQILAHEYANVGFGFDYRLDGYTLSASAQTLVWGHTVYNLKYSVDVRLAREF